MQILELATKLQSIGFTDKQAKVYVAALFLGPSPVQKIAQQAEVNRATTYVILGELAEMGIVSESTESKKTIYVAEPPVSIERFLDDMQKDIVTRKQELKDLMPQLNKTARAEGADTPVIRFYKGEKGSEELSKYLLRKAKKGEEIYSFYNIDEADQSSQSGVTPNIRIKKGLKSKLIYYSTTRELANDKKWLRESKKTTKPVAAEVNLYPGRASLITYEGNKTVGVLIESQQIALALRQLFEEAFDKNTRK